MFEKIVASWPQLVFILFCILLAVRLFYVLFFFTRLAFHKTKPKESIRTNAVTVIICARDEAANLAVNLPGVLVQQYSSTHEVIVVNDNSFDDTKYLLEELRKTYRQLHVIELTQEAKMIQGKKFPLSIGIKTAKYEIVLLTDADCVPATENWIASMQAAYDDDTEIVLGYGAYHKQPGLLNKLIRWETFTSALQYLSYAKAGLAYMGVGRNLSYKKTVFYRHKGFSAHNNIAGGDDDLFINSAATVSNVKINIEKDSFTLSKPASSFAEWKKQKYRHYSTSKYYRPIHKFLLGLYAACSFLFYPVLIVSAIFFNWQYALIAFAVFTVVQTVVYAQALKKLNEQDLLPFVFLLDFWMFFYYIIFAFALIKKPRPTWN
jgi:glycosyltransferase involved in cell wall biosynthesis